MTLDQLLAQLEVVRKEHGGQVEVVARRFGDYLESGPTVHVTQLAPVPPMAWTDPDCLTEEEKSTSSAVTVVFVEH